MDVEYIDYDPTARFVFDTSIYESISEPNSSTNKSMLRRETIEYGMDYINRLRKRRIHKSKPVDLTKLDIGY